MLIADLVFYFFAVVIVFSACMVIMARNPVHSVMFLILAFFNAGGLFLLLGAEFIAMLTIIVYVGAVAILFLFVVMMLDIDIVRIKEGFIKYLPIAAIISAIIAIELVMVLQSSLTLSAANNVRLLLQTPIENADITNTESLGLLLYTDYMYPFQLAGIILLVAMIGAIVLTLHHKKDTKRQNITKQVLRTRNDSIDIVKVQSGKGV